MRIVERRVKATGAQSRVGILRADRGKPLQCEARGGVHGEVENDQFGFAKGGFIERLAREIDAADRVSAFAEPGCG